MDTQTDIHAIPKYNLQVGLIEINFPTSCVAWSDDLEKGAVNKCKAGSGAV